MQHLFTDPHTGTPLDYQAHNELYGIAGWFGHSVTDRSHVERKTAKGLYTSVDPQNQTPFPPELDDLIRLHFLCLSRRVTTVLEFGVGKSTRVFAEALKVNRERHGDFVRTHLRRSTPFQLFSVDNVPDWVAHCRQELPAALHELVNFTTTEVEMTTFNGRVCTAYRQLPDVCPDLIYLDGPGQYGVLGAVRGLTTQQADRLPMSADILILEPFLLPGTLIIVDGRTANARFLRHNLQGNWAYGEFPELELHAFELREPPLGRINKIQLEYCLGW